MNQEYYKAIDKLDEAGKHLVNLQNQLENEADREKVNGYIFTLSKLIGEILSL